MPRRASQTIDRALARELNRTDAGQDVQAVLTLRGSANKASLTQMAADAASVADDLIRRVTKRVGVAPRAVNVLRNINSMIVAAPQEFVRELIAQPEVLRASSNAPTEDLMIEPRKRRTPSPAELGDE
jgi:hypothetical protein